MDGSELVISDNASDDETRAVCEELAGRDSRVRVVRHEANVGAEANFRGVLEQATGTFFMWLADDDWLETGTVAACAERLIERPDHALVCAASHYFRNDEPAFVERPVDLLQSSARARVIGFYRTVTLNGPFYGLTRREQLMSLPPLRTTLAADWLHVASLAKLGKVATVREVAINRSLGGVSKDEASLARAYGLSPREARNWQLAVARAAYRDIAHGPVFSGFPGWRGGAGDCRGPARRRAVLGEGLAGARTAARRPVRAGAGDTRAPPLIRRACRPAARRGTKAPPRGGRIVAGEEHRFRPRTPDATTRMPKLDCLIQETAC